MSGLGRTSEGQRSLLEGRFWGRRGAGGGSTGAGRRRPWLTAAAFLSAGESSALDSARGGEEEKSNLASLGG